MRSLLMTSALLLASCTAAPIGGAAGAATPVPPPPTTLRALERELLPELNRARTDPRGYAGIVGQLIDHFRGMVLHHPWYAVPIRTQEGEPPVREAVAELQRRTAVASLAHSDVLTRAARDLAEDQSRTGRTGHVASDGASTDARVRRHGSWSGRLTENIAYQPDATARTIIVGLIVDDGVPDRGHRINTYDAQVRHVGIACAPHPRYGSVCVMVHAGGVR